jgi:hypothetical protein
MRNFADVVVDVLSPFAGRCTQLPGHTEVPMRVCCWKQMLRRYKTVQVFVWLQLPAQYGSNFAGLISLSIASGCEAQNADSCSVRK